MAGPQGGRGDGGIADAGIARHFVAGRGELLHFRIPGAQGDVADARGALRLQVPEHPFGPARDGDQFAQPLGAGRPGAVERGAVGMALQDGIQQRVAHGRGRRQVEQRQRPAVEQRPGLALREGFHPYRMAFGLQGQHVEFDEGAETHGELPVRQVRNGKGGGRARSGRGCAPRRRTRPARAASSADWGARMAWASARTRASACARSASAVQADQGPASASAACAAGRDASQSAVAAPAAACRRTRRCMDRSGNWVVVRE
ncbi:hypothetical protein ACFS3C_20450 [Azotobacter vinelandii]